MLKTRKKSGKVSWIQRKNKIIILTQLADLFSCFKQILNFDTYKQMLTHSWCIAFCHETVRINYNSCGSRQQVWICTRLHFWGDYSIKMSNTPETDTAFWSRSISHLVPCLFCPLQARSVQLRVVVISERVLGFDHPNTIQQYVSHVLTKPKQTYFLKCINHHLMQLFLLFQVLLSVYLFAGGETALAQRCLYRAKVLLLTIHGGDHPYAAVIDVNVIKLNQVTTDPK